MAAFVTAIVVAAGASTRMGTPKMLIPLDGTPTLLHTLTALDAAARVEELIVVARDADIPAFQRLCAAHPLQKPLRFVSGGDTRGQSVAHGLAAADPRATHIAVHDGARPLVTPILADRVIDAALLSGAATAAVRVKDTIKTGDDADCVAETLPRDRLWAIQTPQVFERTLYATALAEAGDASYTDDCQLIERMGHPVQLVEGDYRNLKLTTPEDVCMAEGLLRQKEGRGMRVGHGYDVHRLVEGRRLILGGVDIPYEKGLLGHSDADVLTHAIMDALLGAAACGDIGGLFPDTDPRYAGADSLWLLGQVMQTVRQAGYTPVNIDATVLAQAPKLKPHIPAMREKLAAACGLPLSAVNVKATTEEGLGFIGSGEGIAAHAVCLLA